MPTPARIDSIRIDFVKHRLQRYETAGDFFYDDGTLRIMVSQTGDQRHEQLVAVHELIEALLCYHRGITVEQVDAFDMGPGANLAEPGDHPDAPYKTEHSAATGVERFMASMLNVDWSEYETALDALERDSP